MNPIIFEEVSQQVERIVRMSFSPVADCSGHLFRLFQVIILVFFYFFQQNRVSLCFLTFFNMQPCIFNEKAFQFHLQSSPYLHKISHRIQTPGVRSRFWGWTTMSIICKSWVCGMVLETDCGWGWVAQLGPRGQSVPHQTYPKTRTHRNWNDTGKSYCHFLLNHSKSGYIF